ncbi:MAG: GNAT family N-acetyltransferase [Acidimicrobiales bacterium]
MIVIRPALPADARAITEIANALLSSTTYEWTEIGYSVGEREHWLQDQGLAGDPVFVAEDGGAVVGWASYGDFRDTNRWPGYGRTAEHSVHVGEGHWGQGIGRSLLVELADHARRAGKRVLVAAIDSTNVRSITFHAKMGFVEVARMPGVGEKWGKRLDLVLMQLDLDRAPRREATRAPMRE